MFGDINADAVDLFAVWAVAQVLAVVDAYAVLAVVDGLVILVVVITGDALLVVRVAPVVLVVGSWCAVVLITVDCFVFVATAIETRISLKKISFSTIFDEVILKKLLTNKILGHSTA